MHIAITGVHVQSDKDAALENALVRVIDIGTKHVERAPLEQLHDRLTHLAFPGNAQAVILQRLKHCLAAPISSFAPWRGQLAAGFTKPRQIVCQGHLQMLRQPAPACPRLVNDIERRIPAIGEQLLPDAVAIFKAHVQFAT